MLGSPQHTPSAGRFPAKAGLVEYVQETAAGSSCRPTTRRADVLMRVADVEIDSPPSRSTTPVERSEAMRSDLNDRRRPLKIL